MLGKETYFYFPQALFLMLLLIPLIYGQFYLKKHRQRQQKNYASPELLPQLMIQRSPFITYIKNLSWLLIWILICISLMDPVGNIHYTSLPKLDSNQLQNSPHEIIFLVDTSASMNVTDGPEGETRLEESKVIMEDIIRQLRGQLVSLYAFTSELTSLVPSTLDYLFVRLSIKDLHIDEGDRGGTALASILNQLEQQAFPKTSIKRYTVILLTDGGDTQVEMAKDSSKEQEKQKILDAIKNYSSKHVRLFTVGMGSLQSQLIPHVTFEDKPVLSKLEPDLLKELAEKANGFYYQADQNSSWDLAQKMVTQLEENTSFDPLDNPSAGHSLAPIKNEDILFDLYYQIPLGIALLLYLFNLLLPDVRRL